MSTPTDNRPTGAIGKLPQYACEHWTGYGIESELCRSYLKLLSALNNIGRLWPEPPHCAEVNPEWVGPNDGKQRAILLEAALNIARKASMEATAAKGDKS